MQDLDQKSFDDRYAAGLNTRRDVIGAEVVNKRVQNADDFNRPMQELLNTYCFNDIWNRPGLPRQTRSLLNIAMLCALSRGPELRAHLNGALNNGVTKEEIQEVLLQAAVYCGVPSGVEGFRVASEVFAERGI